MTSMLGRAASGTVWLGIVNVLSKGSQAVVVIALAAYLGEADLGRATVAVALVNVAATVQSMGTLDVVTRTRRDPQLMASVLLTISLAVSVTVAVVLFAAAGTVAGWLGSSAAAHQVRIAVIGLPFVAVSSVQLALLHRGMDFRRRLLPDAGSTLTGAAVSVALAALGFGADALAYGVLVTFVLQPFLWLVVTRPLWPRWDASYAAEATRWIRVVGIGAVTAIVIINVDYAIVLRLLGEEALGVYSLAFRIAWVPYIAIAVVLGAVAFPVYSHLLREGQEIGEAVAGFVAAVLIVVGGAYTVIALMSDRVVLLGERWQPAAAPLALLCGYGMIVAIVHLCYEGLRACGRSGVFATLQIWHLVALVTALLVLTRWGVRYAALAQLLAAAAVAVPALLLTRAYGGAPRWAVLARPFAAGLVGFGACAVVAAGFRAWTPTDSLPAALAEGIALVGCWFGAVLLLARPTIRRLRSLRSYSAS